MAARSSHAPTKAIIRLQDNIYREMFRLEGQRPGAEMGLAIALLRAWGEVDGQPNTDREWLKAISQIGLRMIEDSLERRSAVTEAQSEPCSPDRVS